MYKYEWTIAFRYLRAKKSSGFISLISLFSLLGIMLGVAALIVVMSVMNGYREELMRLTLGASGHVYVYGSGSYITEYDELASKLRKAKDVASVAPVIERQGLATVKDTAVGVNMRGMTGADFKARPILINSLLTPIHERVLAPGDGVLIGSNLAHSLNLHVGEHIQLLSPTGHVTLFGNMPRLSSYRVAGIFYSGLYVLDSITVFMPLADAQTFFKMPHAVSQIEITTNSPFDALDLSDNLRRELPEYRISDWQELNGNLLDALKIERSVMFLILTLIILVAAFNIISSIVMLVQEKRKAIAILRTMGAGRGSILRIFFICGASIGVIGTLLGVLLGLGFSENIETIRQFLQNFTGLNLFDPVIYYLSRLPAIVQMDEVVHITLMSLGLSCLATLYPAWQASTLHPAEVLRYE